MYMPIENLCSVVTSAGPKTSMSQLGMRIDYTAKLPQGETNVGQVRAISVKTGATAWSYNQRAGMMAVVATGGGSVFAGDATGGFRALDARTGEVRWQTQLARAVSGIPISYAGGRKQFVAVATGPSPESGGLARMTPEIQVGGERVLHVFALNWRSATSTGSAPVPRRSG